MVSIVFIIYIYIYYNIPIPQYLGGNNEHQLEPQWHGPTETMRLGKPVDHETNGFIP